MPLLYTIFQYPTLGSNHRYIRDNLLNASMEAAFSILLSDRTIATPSQSIVPSGVSILSVSYSRIEPSLLGHVGRRPATTCPTFSILLSDRTIATQATLVAPT